ncbi:ABC transporter substrate-binding protein [uncultured Phascolarctobacterium sp.]|uniref:substrate-binding periplasmic protein n=1 Tax=uncultured Phascolarctobacterium sp. TaxID=512296 RepID=UPI0026397C06|nr:transporter substrate-binding domain-containing protein [uncultured Phascolarctobacterium sp.]
MKKNIAVLFFMIVVSLSVLACGGQTAKTGEKVLRVGTDPNFPPFEYYVERVQSHTGFDIDMVNDLGRRMGYERVEFINMPFDKLLEGLSQKRYDVVAAGLSITEKRQQKYAFSEPYVQSRFALMACRGAGRSSMDRKSIGVEAQSSAEQVAAGYAGVQVKGFENNGAALQALLDKRCDYLLADEFTCSFYIANGYGEKVEILEKVGPEDKIGLALRKDDAELLQKINIALKEHKKSGVYNNLLRFYFGIHQ